ncbi:hypothetical protein [Streptomyces sp. UNOC14_S4]|uniref:hypothetical protein n=1 Tax=Streptomyces sp. UNOC14_S4 TaxID=2872340 RepID=UPI001E3DB29E|nr:hypothetical protein [Streptomyces sp. UNOC14_S4]MCC3767363.1 hypothetical protein [Streptomyces sp. UNOC14_S4]
MSVNKPTGNSTSKGGTCRECMRLVIARATARREHEHEQAEQLTAEIARHNATAHS